MSAQDATAAVRAAHKSFGRVASFVAVVSLPVAFVFLLAKGVTPFEAGLIATAAVFSVRGLIDLAYKKIIPMPSLFGTNEDTLREQDALGRRRAAFWKHKLRMSPLFITLIYFHEPLMHLMTNPQALMYAVMMPILLLMNFVILFGPLMLMGITQMKGLEPGDADFGVKLEDVRGQKEAKDEINKVVSLWESGEEFVKRGGKRERGLLFLGAPGVGKTMLAKAIATSFNSPIVLMPGSGFAQTFIGMDAVIVRFLARKARKLAAKWGGQCIIFIDEIDAVGMRRGTLGMGDMVTKHQMPGGMMGGMGSLALNQLLVVMDGIDSPPFFRKWVTNKVNLWIDAAYVIPYRAFGKKLRLPTPKPAGEQIYFVGATNVPLGALDPALVRPGRMGRHIYFREPTTPDRIDIFDLYIGKVSHEGVLGTPEALDELARITTGYSPAEIEQVCNLALTYAQHDGRPEIGRNDITKAMVTIEAGTAVGWGYTPDQERKIAIHEAGHAVCSHLWMPANRSSRLSVRRRGATGGHHKADEIEERFIKTRTELFSDLVWGLGSYAAERVFYSDSTQGVGGDLHSATSLAATMVGRWGMAPMEFSYDDLDVKEAAFDKFERLGRVLMNSARPGEIKMGQHKERAEAILIGQAYSVAWNTIVLNEEAVEKVANALIAEQEIYGDDVVKLLDGVGLVAPNLDTLKWPTL